MVSELDDEPDDLGDGQDEGSEDVSPGAGSGQLSRKETCDFLRISLSKLRRLEDKGLISPMTPPNAPKSYFSLRDVQKLRMRLQAEKSDTSEAIVSAGGDSPARTAVAAAHVASSAVTDMVQTSTGHVQEILRLSIGALSAANRDILKSAEVQNAALHKELARQTARIESLEEKLSAAADAIEEAQRAKLVEEDLKEKRDFNQKMVMQGVAMLQALLASKMRGPDKGKFEQSAVGQFVASLTPEQMAAVYSQLDAQQQALLAAIMASATAEEEKKET